MNGRMGRYPAVGRGWVTALAALATLAGPVPAQETAPDRDGPSVIYLVRHAERATDHPRDPTLSAEGRTRAAELTRLLADAPLTRVHSTRYRRTVQTGTPLAEHHGLEIEYYDPTGEGLAAFAEQLRATPGHHVVVGHSNTTPQLVEALGGDPVSPIEEMEYDRLYVVFVSSEGAVTSTLLRFGAPWEGGGEGG
jgi:phosphohistidine phosphatase SixA